MDPLTSFKSAFTTATADDYKSARRKLPIIDRSAGPLMNKEITTINVTSENVSEIGLFCIKNKNAFGYQKKVDWFKKKINPGLVIKIAADKQGK